jgi:hypothetical protein
VKLRRSTDARTNPPRRLSGKGRGVGSGAQVLIYATVRRRPALCMVIAAGVLALNVAAAAAESAATLDCVKHGRLTRQYTDAELRNALTTMPSGIKEYNSECYQLIQNQLNAQLFNATVTDTTGTGGRSGSSLISAPLLIVLGVVVLAGGGFALAARRRD